MDIKKLAPPSKFVLQVPAREAILSKRASLILLAISLAVLIWVPLAALVLPESSSFAMSAYALTLVGKIMCFAIAALALEVAGLLP